MDIDDQKEKDRLTEYYHKEEEDLTQLLAERHEIPYINLLAVPINTDALKIIPEKEARDAGLAPFGITGKKVRVAVISPKKDKVGLFLEDMARKGYEVTLYMASKLSLAKAWEMYKEASFAEKTEAGVFDVSSKQVNEYMAAIKDMRGFQELITKTMKETTRYKTTRILEVVVAGAIATGASDIHIEPQEKDVRLRFRLDGVLHDMATFTNELYKYLLSRAKLLSGMKLNITDNAQDGRFSIKMEAGVFEVRSSIIPGGYGESLVMRILNPATISVSFEDLGIEPVLFGVLDAQIRRPNGMILTTGPTGSGKTTSLYAFLKRVHTPETKIITIEDPIEYHLSGIMQTQVEREKGYDFLSGLRAALRQDPDIIMVGEIRDDETARTAINASLTGHLVLSTLHTNNAAGVIPRLIDLGVNPKIITSAVNLSLAQRLVRRLCPDCRKEGVPTEKEAALILRALEDVRKKRPVNVQTAHVWRAHEGDNNTCVRCGGLGYKGRIGVYEGIVTDTEIERVITEGNPSEREVKKAAEKQNILSMREDGIMKVLAGTTSLEELGRVIDLAAE